MNQQNQAHKLLIHQVLSMHGFYRFSLRQLRAILTLLSMPFSKNPKEIQINTIEGLMRIVYSQNPVNSQMFDDSKFKSIPSSIKIYVCNLLKDVAIRLGRNILPIPQQMEQASRQYHYANMRLPSFNQLNRDPKLMHITLNQDQMKLQKTQIQHMRSSHYVPNPINSHQKFDKRQYLYIQPERYVQVQNKAKKIIVKEEEVRLPTIAIYQSCSIEVQTQLTLCQQDLIMNVKPIIKSNSNRYQQKMHPAIDYQIDKQVQRSFKDSDSQQKIQINLQNACNLRPLNDLIMVESQQNNYRDRQVSLTAKYALQSNHIQQGMHSQALLDPQIMSCFAVHDLDHDNIEYPLSEEQQKKELNKRLIIAQIQRQIEGVKSRKRQQQMEESKQQLQKDRIRVNQMQLQQINQGQGKVRQLEIEQKRKKQEQIMLERQHFQAFSKCPCAGEIKSSRYFVCHTCSLPFHLACLRISEQQQQSQCASCKLKLIDPLQKIQAVISQFYFSNPEPGHQFQSKLNLRQYCAIRGAKNQIQLRCLKIDGSIDPIEITWPDECIICLNNTKLAQISALLSSSVLKKRRDYPINIGQKIFSIQQQSMDDIRLSVSIREMPPQNTKQKRINNNHTFLLGVYFIEKITAKQLFNSTLQSITPFSQNYLNDLMSFPDDEIYLQREIFSVLDPYSKNIINTPVRGRKCVHGQCFDLKTYLTFMSGLTNRNWKCPVCSREAKSFLLDSIQIDLIRRFTESQIIPSAVIVLKDGTILLKMNGQSESQDQAATNKPVSKRTKKIQKMQQKNQKIALNQGQYLDSISHQKKTVCKQMKKGTVKIEEAESRSDSSDSDFKQKKQQKHFPNLRYRRFSQRINK